uniref:Integrase zinc-binding domain-containing protein n=1 Tax=Solanum lycopersicum TaxID=4081 RepID=A0A3Q7FZN3_SOLLC
MGKMNAIVLSWLLNSISKSLLGGVAFASSAQSVWNDLKERCKGHIKDQFYKLIRYPSDFKSKRKLNNGAYMVGSDEVNSRKHGFEDSSYAKTESRSLVTKLKMQIIYMKLWKTLQKLYTGKLREVGKEDDDLYLLRKNLAQEKLKLISFVVPEKQLKEHSLSEYEVDLWYKRLGHGSSFMMRKVFPVSLDVIDKVVNNCSVCPYAKQTRRTRRSIRGVKPPVWMKDYVSFNVGKHVEYPIHECVEYNHLSKSYQELVAAMSMYTEPATFDETSKDSKIVEAMQAEVKALQENNTWDLVEFPKRIGLDSRYVKRLGS